MTCRFIIDFILSVELQSVGTQKISPTLNVSVKKKNIYKNNKLVISYNINILSSIARQSSQNCARNKYQAIWNRLHRTHEAGKPKQIFELNLHKQNFCY